MSCPAPSGPAPLPTGFLALPPAPGSPVPGLRRKVGLVALRALGTAAPPDREAAPRVAAFRRWLHGRLRDRDTRLLDAVLAPDVLPSALALSSGAADPSRAWRTAVPGFLLRVGASPEPVVWDLPAAPLVLPGGRVLDAGVRAVALHAGGAELRLPGGRLVTPDDPDLPTRPSRLPLAGGLHLALVDTNPLADLEEHPEKCGNTLDLGGRPPEAWQAALDEALAAIAAALPAWHAELLATFRRLVPVGWDPERHLSASYREAPGLAYLTLHPDPLTMAEAVVHEVQHGKLNLLTWLDPLLRNGLTTWTASPVRPDLRPLHGVLLAVHAFVPVAALHHELARTGHPLAAGPAFARRRAAVLESNERGLAVLRENADPTPTGRRVLDALETLHARLVEAAHAPRA